MNWRLLYRETDDKLTDCSRTSRSSALGNNQSASMRISRWLPSKCERSIVGWDMYLFVQYIFLKRKCHVIIDDKTMTQIWSESNIITSYKDQPPIRVVYLRCSRSGQSQQLRPLLYVNVVVIDLNSTDGSIKSIGPQQHFIHRIVRQTLDSFVTVFYVSRQRK
jgi:hypothetical protein